MIEYVLIFGVLSSIIAVLTLAVQAAAGTTTGVVSLLMMSAMSTTYFGYNRMLPWNEIRPTDYAKIVDIRNRGYAANEITAAMDDRRITNLELVEIRKSISAQEANMLADLAKDEIMAGNDLVIRLK